jgi:hypothetical protein
MKIPAKPFFRVALAAIAVSVGVAQTVSLFQQISERLTANSLKADVSFLASDALEGRGTPSKGLDIAAEYIAAQFRRAGLEPAGDDGYFQTAPFADVTPNTEGLDFSVEGGGQTLHAGKEALSIQTGAALDLSHAGAFKLLSNDTAALDALTPEQGKVKVLLLEIPASPGQPATGGRGGRGGRGGGVSASVLQAAAKAQAALVVVVRPAAQTQTTSQTTQLKDTSLSGVPVISVSDDAIYESVTAAKPGPMDGTVSVHMAAPAVVPVKLRNVIGVLRGSDPVLKDTFVVLTGHYDHLGIRGTGPGDHIFNGANDDASGTSSVIEIANTLSGLPSRPKRSIIFIALFGEERGDLGSHYYAQHPVFPLAKTIADVNLEQLGRTDENGEGQKIGQFNLTGFDYTNMPAIFRQYGEMTGIKVVKDEAKSDPYFSRSDNAAFAAVGVPSTTLSVTYAFSDYHGAGDEWPKLDYENMAKVDRTIALAAYHMADSTEEPQWNAGNPKTAPYRQARGK